MTETTFKGLEEKVDELIQLCAEMKTENQMLRDSAHVWRNEREALINKHQLARVRLEKVLRRLKTLESSEEKMQ